MAVATFDYGLWSARYPALASKVDSGLAAAYFAEAGLYLDNTDCSPVQGVGQRGVLLNMLVAHIALLSGAGTADGSAPGVGRVTSASEGSVSVSMSLNTPGSAEWFAQTAPGLAFWQATAAYRTMAYVPGPVPFLDVPGSPTGGWPWLR